MMNNGNQMNKISQMRQAIKDNGTVTLNTDDFNQLQAEWIKRAGIEINAPQLESRNVLDKQLKDSGLLTISQILNGTPMDAMHVCAEVVDLDSFEEWLKVNQESFLSMKARLEVKNRQEDEIYEWVLSHSSVFHSVMLNFKAAVKQTLGKPKTESLK